MDQSDHIALSELMTIAIWFHRSGYRTFKWYYKDYVSTLLKPYFPRQLSYNRFVEVMSWLIAPMALYLMNRSLGKCSGISFVDSTTGENSYPLRSRLAMCQIAMQRSWPI